MVAMIVVATASLVMVCRLILALEREKTDLGGSRIGSSSTRRNAPPNPYN
jgi:hypothetical protein